MTLAPLHVASALALAFAVSCVPKDACMVQDDCSSSQVCENERCQASAGEGAPCRDNGTCNADGNYILNGAPQRLMCSEITRRCVFEGELTAPCERASDCATKLCEQGACIAPKPNGAACDGDEACLGRMCHPLTGKCGPANAGEPCETWEQCQSELICFEGTCDELLGMGGACSDNRQCARGLACVLERCGERLGSGATCKVDDDCASSRCEGSVCIGAAGERCEGDGPCQEGLTCGVALDGARHCIRLETEICSKYGPCSEEECQSQCGACEVRLTGDTDVVDGVLVELQASYCLPPGP